MEGSWHIAGISCPGRDAQPPPPPPPLFSPKARGGDAYATAIYSGNPQTLGHPGLVTDTELQGLLAEKFDIFPPGRDT